MRIAQSIELSEVEHKTLEELSRGRKVSVRLAERAKIILLAAQGMENIAIAARRKITRPKAGRWRDRDALEKLKGIAQDASRSGRIATIAVARKEQVGKKTLHELPAGATHWSRRTMAAASGRSDSTVGRIWRTHGLKPHSFCGAAQ